MSANHQDKIASSVRHCKSTNSAVDIAYRTFGDSTNPPLVLVCGLNGQLLQWHADFLEGLVAAGFFVVIMDNRDTGLSTKFDGVACPSPLAHALPSWLQFTRTPEPYTLDDMAHDVWALLDVVVAPGAKAFIAGTSMGGMIAQCAMLLHPERTLGLISIMSTTGASDLPDSPLWVKLQFLKKPKSDELADRLQFRVDLHRNMFSVNASMDEDEIRRMGHAIFERSTYIAGGVRHIAAIKRAPGRDDALRALGERTPPSLVIHGEKDVIFPVEHGQRTADVLKGSKLVVIEDMGHHLSHRPLRERIIQEICDFAASSRASP